MADWGYIALFLVSLIGSGFVAYLVAFFFLWSCSPERHNPDVVIGDNYLSRWFVIPRNRFFNIYLHEFLASDDPRAPHDHPWNSFSIMLRGEMTEFYIDEQQIKTRKLRRGSIRFRSSTFSHRLELDSKSAITIFITGPRIRQWGFHCPGGRWVHWKEFTDESGRYIGKGCD